MSDEDLESTLVQNSEGKEQTIVTDDDQEDAVTEQSDPDYKIHCYGGDLDVEGLVRRFKRGEIYRPEFQREYVWTRKQASRLVESILIGLPIPSLFLYRDELDNKLHIIDGLQRLTTLHAFREGTWPSSSAKFQLTVPEASKFHGLSYSELEEKYQRKFDNTIIHVLFINQHAPSDDKSSAFHIFERLNSEGTPLQPQEMRNALYAGTFKDCLSKLNANESWRSVFGNEHKRSKDKELILRFLALYNTGKEYRQPMKLFLNKFMGKYQNADPKQIDKFCEQFEKTLARIVDALGKKAFNVGPNDSFSVPYFDAFMVAVAKLPKMNDEAIERAYSKIRKNSKFQDLIRTTTADQTRLMKRIDMVEEALNGKL